MPSESEKESFSLVRVPDEFLTHVLISATKSRVSMSSTERLFNLPKPESVGGSLDGGVRLGCRILGIGFGGGRRRSGEGRNIKERSWGTRRGHGDRRNSK